MMRSMDVSDELRHRRTRRLYELVGDAPHLAECPVYDPGAQIGPQEDDSVVDRVQHRIELLKYRLSRGQGCFSRVFCPVCRLLASLQLRDIEVSQQAATIRQRSDLV